MPARSSSPRTSSIRRACRPARGRRCRERPHRTAARSRSAWTSAATSAASRSLSPKRISSVATVSFSLTIGTVPQVEQAAQGPVGVAVVRPPGHVVDGEQHLADGPAVPAERLGVGAASAGPGPTLAAACWVARSRGRRLEPERGQAGRDRAGRDEHDLAAVRGEPASASTSASTRAGSSPPSGGGQRRRADLDHDPAGRGDDAPGGSCTRHCGPLRRAPAAGFSHAGPAAGAYAAVMAAHA